MDLSSRWDRFAGLFILLSAVIALPGCQGLLGGSSKQSGSISAVTMNLDFGTAVVGSSKQLTDIVTNRSSAAVTIASAASSDPSFQVTAPVLPFALLAGQSATLMISFTPQAAGKPTGKIAVMSDFGGASEIDIAVAGSAIAAGKLMVSPSSLGFGSVRVGQSQTQAATLTNSGGTTVTVSQDSVSSGAFTVSGLVLPATLAAGQSVSLNVTFAPKATGSVSGNVTVNGESSLTMKDVRPAGTPATKATTVVLSVSGAGTAAGQIGAAPANVAFGNVTVGSTPNQNITLTNSSTGSVTISQASASGTGYSISGITLPVTLNAGQSTSFTATFAPAAAGASSGSVSILSSAPNATLNIALSGTGVSQGALAASPASISFGSVPVGGTQSQTETLRNSGGSALHIAAANVTGTGFSTSGLTVPTTLNAGQSLTFNVTFAPAAGGAVSGSLALTADGTVPNINVTLSGTGTAPGQLTVSPVTVNFGSVTVGVTQTQAGTLTAGTGGVTISGSTSSNAEFALSGISLPITLVAGQSAPFNYTFTPQASGAAAGTIAFASNASNGAVAASVNGTGVAAAQHSVSLGWTASTSTVNGYNVYRGTQSGGPYAIVNGAIETSTTYTDNSVQVGQTYYYVVTAVDGSGNESVDSNQAQALVPTP